MCISGEFLVDGTQHALTRVSFVRSVSMDTWHEEQIKRMQVRKAGHEVLK